MLYDTQVNLQSGELNLKNFTSKSRLNCMKVRRNIAAINLRDFHI